MRNFFLKSSIVLGLLIILSGCNSITWETQPKPPVEFTPVIKINSDTVILRESCEAYLKNPEEKKSRFCVTALTSFTEGVKEAYQSLLPLILESGEYSLKDLAEIQKNVKSGRTKKWALCPSEKSPAYALIDKKISDQQNLTSRDKQLLGVKLVVNYINKNPSELWAGPGELVSRALFECLPNSQYAEKE